MTISLSDDRDMFGALLLAITSVSSVQGKSCVFVSISSSSIDS